MSRIILIIEDDLSLAKLYQVELEVKGYKTVTASDGEEGFNKAESLKPDIILLDIMMPKQDGLVTLDKLKNQSSTSKIPVIMLTNFGQEKNVKEAFEKGATDFVLKYRVTPSEVAAKIKNILEPQHFEIPEE